MNSLKYYASGKLLLFGEYLVLRGSECLSVPLAAGQSLVVSTAEDDHCYWKCFEGEHEWFSIFFSKDLEIISTSDTGKARIVKKLLLLILRKTTGLQFSGKTFRFDINFHRNYGFGTSATFISLLSQWSGVDPYLLLENSFGGSGFDVATATAESPIIYQMRDHKVRPAIIPEILQTHLLFIYSGKKQHSAHQVSLFSKIETDDIHIRQMNSIVNAVEHCKNITSFESLMVESERLLSGILKIDPVKKMYFEDYPFAIKSLGAWGGDFIMATFRNEKDTRNYFSEKGCTPVFNYQQLIR